MRAGALFGMLSSALGFLALALLAMAACLPVSTERLKNIFILTSTAALFQPITLVAGAAKNCEYCKTKGIRLEQGGVFAVVAFVLYTVAAIHIFSYWRAIVAEASLVARDREENTSNDEGETLSLHPQTHPATMVEAPTKRIEREYIDENGELVKEINFDDSSIFEFSSVATVADQQHLKRIEREYVNANGELVKEIIFDDSKQRKDGEAQKKMQMRKKHLRTPETMRSTASKAKVIFDDNAQREEGGAQEI